MPCHGPKPQKAKAPKPQKAKSETKVKPNVDNRAAAAKPKPQPKTKPKAASDPGSKELKVPVEHLMKEECDNKEIIDEFICGICQVHVVGCSPKLTSCSHLFCGDCMEQWFASHQTNKTWAQRAETAGSERTAPCPVCKHQLHEGDSLYSVSPTGTAESAMLWQMLSSLKVCCANHSSVRSDGKCTWTGQYGAYHKHVSSCTNEPRQALSDDDAIVEPVKDQWDSPGEGVDASSLGTGSEKAASDQCATESTEASLGIDEPTVVESDEAEEPDKIEEPASTDSDEAEIPAKTEEVADSWETEAPEDELEEEAVATELPKEEAPSESESTHDTVEHPVEVAASSSQAKVSGGYVRDAPDAPREEGQLVMGDLMQSIKALFDLKLQETGSDSPVAAAPEKKEPSEEQAPEVNARESRKVKVMHAFSGDSETQLVLKAGDFVFVDEQHSSGWTYGRKCCDDQAAMAGPLEGWFPQWSISP